MVTVKKEFLNKRLAFGKNANPLSKRTEAELIELAIMGLESGNKGILKFFEEKGFPSLFALKKAKTDSLLKKVVAVVVKEDEGPDLTLVEKNRRTRNFSNKKKGAGSDPGNMFTTGKGKN